MSVNNTPIETVSQSTMNLKLNTDLNQSSTRSIKIKRVNKSKRVVYNTAELMLSP